MSDADGFGGVALANGHTSADLLATLKEHWGFDRLRPEQVAAVQATLDRHDSLVVLSTGFGKSICFQLPAAASTGVTIVLTPLLALAEDQLNDLNDRDVCAQLWASTVDPARKEALLRDLESEKVIKADGYSSGWSLRDLDDDESWRRDHSGPCSLLWVLAIRARSPG